MSHRQSPRPLRAALVAALAGQGAMANVDFQSQLSKCPLECSSLSSSNWTAYHNTRNLALCDKPMLIDFALHAPVDSQDNDLTIYACTGEVDESSVCKDSANLGKESNKVARTSWSGSSHIDDVSSLVAAAGNAASHIAQKGCSSENAKSTFSYLNGVYFGVYSGGQIHSKAAVDLVQESIKAFQSGTQGDYMVSQICDKNSTANDIVGVVVSSSTKRGSITALAAAQNAVKSWHQGKCVDTPSPVATSTTNIKVKHRSPASDVNSRKVSGRGIMARAECRTIQVNGGDGCDTLAVRCGISPADFTKYNSDSKLCGNLKAGQHVCCSKGTLPDYKPKPNADGSCHTYFVQTDDWCSSIAATNSLTEKDLMTFNKNTWGWTGCDPLSAHINICLSKGDPPMPPPITNAVCGPQKPGTKPPTDGTSLAKLNPCPLNACCDKWGQCGINKDFCTQIDSSTGAPGTSKDKTNGCISNCGTDIIKGSAPSTFIKLGYFEAFNNNRKCLHMDVRSLVGFDFNVIHFAFANITQDFEIDVSGTPEQFEYFTKMSGFKKIVSFGGWSFSTEGDTYPIFRKGVTDANRQTFATNVANFVKKHDLDGADFDWEYPGAPDIKGVPPGDPEDGDRYLHFLAKLRGTLPKDKSVSIAAPASFWYLKGFPIKAMAKVVDYIVYMTYDLHGQWDYDNHWANPDCDSDGGNCLRSHVNSTETDLALAMITKAGVPSNKVVVGVSSYGRAFGMIDPKCTGPTCLFEGPASGATKGKCTDTAGYISNAELNDLIGTGKATTHLDKSSDSNIAIYGKNWVSYMDNEVKAKRTARYSGLNMGGTTDWAVDLSTYTLPYDEAQPDHVIDWKHKHCEKDLIGVNSLDTPEKRERAWSAAGCQGAWTEAIAYYKKHNKHGFSMEIADFFNVTGSASNIQCEVLAPSNGCKVESAPECEKDLSPAGFFILHSMMAIGSMYWNLYDATRDAKGDVWTDVDDLSDTFSPAPPKSEAAEILMGLLEQGWGMFIAPQFEKVLFAGGLGAEATGEEKGTKRKEILGAVLDEGWSQIDNQVGTDSEYISAEKTLKENLKKIGDLFLSGITAVVKGTFNGNDQAIKNLWNMIDDGNYVVANATNTFELSKALEKPFYAKLIPTAWGYRSDGIRGPQGIVVVDSGDDCEEGDECPDQVPGFPNKGLSVYMTTAAARESCYCHKGTMYYLVQAVGPAENCRVGGNPSSCDTQHFETPQGFDALDGTKWSGLTIGDFVAGSVNTWLKNDKKNGYKPDWTSGAVAETFLSGDLTAPGGFNIPVCSAGEAWGNWREYTMEKNPVISLHFPCD